MTALRTHLCLAALAAASAAHVLLATTYTWQAGTDLDWTDAANWNPSSGYPADSGDEAVLPQLANAVYTINVQPATAVTMAVLRVTSNAGQRYRIYNPVSSAVRSDIFLDNPSGNAQLLLHTSAGSGALVFDGNAAARHRLYLLDDLDIVVSNGTSEADIEVLRTLIYGSGRTINKYGAGNLRFYTNTDGVGLTNCTFNVFEGQLTLARDNLFPLCTVIMHEGTLLFAQFLSTGHRGNLKLHNNTTLRAQANGAGESRFSNVTVHGSCTFDIQTGSEWLTVYGTLAGTGTVSKIGAQTLYLLGSIAPGFSAGELTLNEAEGAIVPGTSTDALILEMGLEAGGACDLLTFANMDAPIDLANIDLHLALNGTTSFGVTNWFLVSNALLNNDFSTTMLTGPHAAKVIWLGKSDDGLSYGFTMIPEPCAGLAALAGVACYTLRRRAAC